MNFDPDPLNIFFFINLRLEEDGRVEEREREREKNFFFVSVRRTMIFYALDSTRTYALSHARTHALTKEFFKRRLEGQKFIY